MCRAERLAKAARLAFMMRRSIPPRTRMTDTDLLVALIDADPARAAILLEGLREAGYARVVHIAVTDALLFQLAELAPDVVLIDLANPSRDVLEGMFEVSRNVRRPVAMFVDQSDRSMIEAAIDAGVSTYVVDGLRKERIRPLMDTTISRYRAYQRLRDELEQTRTALSDRKIIDRAKGLLMQQRGLSEADAYKRMRSGAMTSGKRLVDIAQSIITAAEIMGEGL
jgi:two-component system, response regulator / RNA-binding antiterminator